MFAVLADATSSRVSAILPDTTWSVPMCVILADATPSFQEFEVLPDTMMLSRRLSEVRSNTTHSFLVFERFPIRTTLPYRRTLVPIRKLRCWTRADHSSVSSALSLP